MASSAVGDALSMSPCRAWRRAFCRGRRSLALAWLCGCAERRFRAFWHASAFVRRAALSGRGAASQAAAELRGRAALQLGRPAAIVRAKFARRTGRLSAASADSPPQEDFDVHYARFCARPRCAAATPTACSCRCCRSSLIFVIMYFLILRPQQKRVKDACRRWSRTSAAATPSSPRRAGRQGHKVVDDDQIEVEIADGVRMRQMRQMVTDVRAKGEPVEGRRGGAS